MTRRKLILSAIGSAGLSLAYLCYVEPRWFDVSRPRVDLRRVPLPAPVRILHLTDLHFSPHVPLSLIQSAISLGLSLRPDLICLTGDFITAKDDLTSGTYAAALSRLSRAAPTFAVLGNHDGGSWAGERGAYPDHRGMDNLLARSGIQLLHNASTRVRVGNSHFTIAGVGDLWSREIDSHRAFAAVDPNLPAILLAHNPDSKDEIANHPWDLMLSGHTHGGQILLPFDGPRFAPVADRRYVAGLRPWGERHIHVSRGVGSLGGVRFRCRPAVDLLEVR